MLINLLITVGKHYIVINTINQQTMQVWISTQL